MRNKKINKKWFTIIEILLSILIFSFVIIWWFQAFFFILWAKSTLIDKINIEKETVYFSQKFFEMIKKWWTIDYEEYYNRQIAWNTTYLSWHYDKPTWFWNFSGSTYWFLWNYANQFMTWWEFTWVWPDAFSMWTNVSEIYLISWDKKTRTFFRWRVELDPDRPNWTNCNNINSTNPTWTWCLWTLEFLKLDWKDYWKDNNQLTLDSDWTQFDWIVDTWLINKDFNPSSTELLAWWTSSTLSLNDNLWQPIFPNSMNISNFKIFPYPNSDIKLAWKDNTDSLNIANYLRISFEILPSWKKRKKIKWNIAPINFSTTISLTDVFSR